MDNKEILEYYERCATFLGAEFVDDDKEAFPDGYYILNSDDFDLPYKLEDMDGFYYDWNYIMYIISKIQEKYNRDHYIASEINLQICKTSLDKKGWCEISLEGRFRPEVTICTRNENMKLAVVESINKFLIWYNNKTTKN